MSEAQKITTDIVNTWGEDYSLSGEADKGDEGSYNYWTYTNVFPEMLLGEEVSYSFQLTNEEDLLSDYIVELDHAKNLIVNTLKAELVYTIIWKDAKDAYSTRISVEDLLKQLTLYYKVSGKTEVNSLGLLSAMEEGRVAVVPDKDDASMWNITITEFPRYAEDGFLYVYYIEQEGEVSTDNTGIINIKEGSDFAGEEVVYTPEYVNQGNHTEQTDACYEGGILNNYLTGETEFEVYKQWLDDGSTETKAARPSGRLNLFRYPDTELTGRDYTTSSPVQGMEMPLDTGADSYRIMFNESSKFPRFDEEGNEYVYFLQEILSGANAKNYTKVFYYGDESDNVDPTAKNAVFNGGILQNKRTGTEDVVVTKTWKAAAKQNMSASVTLLLERRTKGDEKYEEVAEEKITGFRAEEMTKDFIFAGMEMFDENGLPYEYRITEKKIEIDRVEVDVTNPDNYIINADGEKLCTIGGYTYKLDSTIDENGNMLLTNSLVGESEVWVKKVWNGYESLDLGSLSDIQIDLYQNGKKISSDGADVSIKIVNGNGDIVSETILSSTITPENATVQKNKDNVHQEGNWLVISGLPRYDEDGREYLYTIRESNAPENHHVGYSQSQSQKTLTSGEYVGLFTTTVTNTPVSGTGRYVEVVKEWFDDGDKNCRGDVEAVLYYYPPGAEEAIEVNRGTLSNENNWNIWLQLKGKANEADENYDEDYANYFVLEDGIKRDQLYKVLTDAGEPISPEGFRGNIATSAANKTPIGVVTTDVHNYNAYVYRSTNAHKYTLINVRTGTVLIDLSKTWIDAKQHEKDVKEVLFEILQIQGETTQTVQSVTLNGISDENENDIDESNIAEGSPWKSITYEFPKYNEKGEMYQYEVKEAQVTDKSNNIITVNGNTYELGIHTYAVSVSAERNYGEHNPGQMKPEADDYHFAVTNARTETISFKVYKIWNDVIRTVEDDSLTDAEKAAQKKNEVNTRPDIYLELYSQLGENGERAIMKDYVERIWTTIGDSYNEYHWLCEFDALPRYNADGVEIIYSVQEVMKYPGEYRTEYYDKGTVEVNDPALTLITDAQIYTTEEPNANERGYVLNGGTIVNSRQGNRTLNGIKIWKNIPSGMKSQYYPEITVTLNRYEYDETENKYQYKTVSDVDPIVLKEGVTSYSFGTKDLLLPKYDEYGVFIKYRAQETSTKIPGYKDPLYDEYNFTVTNTYDTEGNKDIVVNVTKTWRFPAGLNLTAFPTATIDLMQVMTDGSTRLTDTAKKINSVSFTYDKDKTDAYTHAFTELPVYGPNGKPYDYYVREMLPGYTITTDKEDTSTDKIFNYTVNNDYNGQTTTQQYIRLDGVIKWIDDSNRFLTRPAEYTGVTLKVYREIEGVSGSREEITDKVTISQGTSMDGNSWAYSVKANNINTGTTGSGKDQTLYYYAPNGKKYIYYVEETHTSNNYDSNVLENAGTQDGDKDVDPVTGIHTITAKGAQDSETGDITASFEHKMEGSEYSFTKTWLKETDAGNTTAIIEKEYDMMLPVSITFKVQYLNGGTWVDYQVNGTTVVKVLSNLKEALKASADKAAGTISISMSELPKYDDSNALRSYRVIETHIGSAALDGSNSANGYTAVTKYADNDSDKTVEGITNTLTTIPLYIKKVWDDNDDQDGERPDSLDFTITRDANAGSSFKATMGSDEWAESANGIVVYVPKYSADGTTEAGYTVTEVVSQDLEADYPKRSVTGTGTDTDPLIFENVRNVQTIDISVSKSFTDETIGTTIGNGEDNANLDTIRSSSVTVTLQRKIAGSDDSWETVPEEALTYTYKNAEQEEITVVQQAVVSLPKGEENSWSHTWVNLDSRYNLGTRYIFRVVETDINGYTPYYKDSNSENAESTNIVSVTETNCKTTEAGIKQADIAINNKLDTTSITAVKVWNHKNSIFTETGEITFNLYYRLKAAEGAPENSWQLGSATLTAKASSSWKATLNGLPIENKDGVLYEYKVEEAKIRNTVVAVDDSIRRGGSYQVSDSVTTKSNNVFTSTVTNTLITRSDITVQKEWIDNNNQDGIRPSELTVVIVRDLGTTYEQRKEAKLNTGNSWTYTFTNLPKYRVDGELSTYTVVEKEAITGYTITYSLDGTNYQETAPEVPEAVAPETVSIIKLKNSHTPKTMEIEVSKTWEDTAIGSYFGNGEENANINAIRSSAVTVYLQRSGEAQGEWYYVLADGTTSVTKPETGITLNGNNNWTYNWTNLPARFTNDQNTGTKYKYRVVEDGVTSYSTSYIDSNKSGGTYSADYAIVTEDECVEGTGENAGKNIAAIGVKNTLDTVDLQAEKIWNHNNGQYSYTGEVTVALYYRLTGETNYTACVTGTEKTLNQTGSWKAEFSNLPKSNAAGVLYEYTVKEISIGTVNTDTNNRTGNYLYTVSDTQTKEDGSLATEVTNTFIKRAAITVQKVWEDGENRDGIRTTSVSGVLIKDEGTTYQQTLDFTLNNTNSWKNTWSNLPKYREDGELCTYKIVETAVDGYTTTYSKDGTSYSSDALVISDAQDSAVTITVKNTYTPKVMNLEVQKVWEDSSIGTSLGNTEALIEAIRGESVSVSLQRFVADPDDGEGTWYYIDANGNNVSEKVSVSLVESEDYKYSFTNLPVNYGNGLPYSYRIVEDTKNGYSVTYCDRNASNPMYTSDVTVITEADCTNEVTGIYNGSIGIKNTLDTVSLNVSKVWDHHHDNNSYAYEDTVTLQLIYRLAGDENWTDAAASVIELSEDTEDETKSFKGSFTNLPKMNNAGTLYEYSVREVSIGEVAVSSNKQSGSYKYTVSATQTSGNTQSVTVTNSFITRTDIKVIKVWNDGNNQDGNRQSEVTVTLIKDEGTPAEEEFTQKLKADNQWTATFTNLPKYAADGTAHTYKVVESTTLTGYTVNYSNNGSTYTDSPEEIPEAASGETVKTVYIRNSYTPKTVNVEITKIWDDSIIGDTIGTGTNNANIQAIRSDEVSVYLQRGTEEADGDITWVNLNASGEEVTDPATIKLKADNNWNYTWSALPSKYEGGFAYHYRVLEEAVTGYTTVYCDNNGEEAQYTSDPATLAEGDYISDENNVYTGSLYVKNVVETVSLNLEKIWEHKNNPYFYEDSVSLRLYYRLAGEEAFKVGSSNAVVRISSEDSYLGTINNLPKMDKNGTLYEYTVKETAIGQVAVDSEGRSGNYTFTVTDQRIDGSPIASTVTNTIITRSDIQVTKIWDDGNNQDGLRPSSITVTLVKDNSSNEADRISKNLADSNNWTVTFTDLPKYNKDGTACTYHVVEEAVSGYSLTYSLNNQNYQTTAPFIPESSSPLTASIVYLKNTHTVNLVNVKGIKVWADQENAFESRPESVVLQLMSTTNSDGITDAQKVSISGMENPVTISATEEWTQIWSNLPANRNSTGTGTEAGSSSQIYYSIIELTNEGETAEKPIVGYLEPGMLETTENNMPVISITNTLDTVNIVVTKQWEDFNNLYESRPDSIVFSLYQRIAGSGEDYKYMAKQSMTADASLAEQVRTFTGYPKMDTQGNLYEYMVIESEVKTGTDTLSLNGEASGSYLVKQFTYDYSASSSQTAGGFAAVVKNTLEKEKTIISGNVLWQDANNQFESRPEDVDVTLYYKDVDGEFKEYPYLDGDGNKQYEITWNYDNEKNQWSYEIEGPIKYHEGTLDRWEYAVSVTEPEYYDNPSDQYAVSSVAEDGSLVMEDVILKIVANSSLLITKERDRGPESIEFFIGIYTSKEIISEDNPGILYKGNYKILEGDQVVKVGTTEDGYVAVRHSQSILFEELPDDFYYYVEEAEHRDYEMNSEKSENLSGSLLSAEIDVLVYNSIKAAELAIENQTVNPDIHNDDGTLKDAGGKVQVVTGGEEAPEISDWDDYKEGQVSVIWMPDTYWLCGDSFTITYLEFGADTEKELTILNYMNEDGSLKDLKDCDYIEPTGSEGGFDYFISIGAVLEFTTEGAVKLILAEDADEMPRQVKISVEFYPTLAVDNVTEKDEGGIVKVEKGAFDENADGVPAYGGSPYRATTVFGQAKEGYRVDLNNIYVRNLNDLDGEAVRLEIREDNTFDTTLNTTINGKDAEVEISGYVIYKHPVTLSFRSAGSSTNSLAIISGLLLTAQPDESIVTDIQIVLNQVTVPLQIDLMFVKTEEGIGSEDGNSSNENPSNDNKNNGQQTQETEQAQEEVTGDSTKEIGSNPGTGDQANVIAAFLLAIGAAFTLLFLRKKKETSV
ncbi:Cna B-type domain-containing protein [Lachnospiraceae bacterium OttesenSCG-928-D06]|nr:Cna B-type domain-containing protein [Lachnospiraceae bacterium OttesenSCG-928-D06]